MLVLATILFGPLSHCFTSDALGVGCGTDVGGFGWMIIGRRFRFPSLDRLKLVPKPRGKSGQRSATMHGLFATAIFHTAFDFFHDSPFGLPCVTAHDQRLQQAILSFDKHLTIAFQRLTNQFSKLIQRLLDLWVQFLIHFSIPD
ncbi:hypothetical protein RB10954 [Rhodopirellula baltica SH 1]|uniref:Uncharacterized protein n=1 Tax=Rhodopirellula baltica (strain DSM 10527 / NCIMB 13988 / SH1) TaxID=243090 RepID=Q7UJZ7_RHOBA|nr:hypothetical protein RB10954 [Rhodopirellula baltica SH 1]